MKSIKEYVWFYYNKGFSIIPIGANGNLKAPSIKSWDRYKEERASKKQIEEWLSQGLFKGIGVIGGGVSDNLAVIDIDSADIPELVGLNLDSIAESGNWVVKTGKGWHIYCKDFKPVKTRKIAQASMDLKANKGYVVAPPSPHENGSHYEFLEKPSRDLPRQDVMSWFDDIVSKVKSERGIKPQKLKEKQDNDEEIPLCIQEMLDGAESGRRNETAFAIINYYKKIKKRSLKEVKTIMEGWNARNIKPLKPSELEATIESAFSSDESTGCSHIRDLGYCPFENARQCNFFKHEYQHIDDLNKYGVISKGGKVSYPNLAELIKNEYDFNFLVVRDESTDKKAIFAYEDGFYNKNGKDYIKGLVHEYLEDKATIKAKDEVIAAIVDTSTSVDRSEVEPPKYLLNFNNGIYNLNTGKLSKHNSEYKFLQKVPIDYKPGKKCPKVLKFMHEVLKDDDVPLVQEMFGYCLYRSYQVNAAFVLYGTGRNGKGVMLKLLRTMLGQKNICSRKLHEITNDTFAKADLYGRMANICGEMEGHTLKSTANLKELTGEDWVTAQRKYHGSFQFQNYAKLIFSTNEVPKSNEVEFGFLDRMKVIEFTQVFNASNKKTDTGLADKLTSDKDEMQGLLLWSIEGLKRLLKNHAFCKSETMADMGKSYDNAVNLVWHWLEEHVQYSTAGNFVTPQEIFDIFDSWCIKENRPRATYLSFTKKLYGYSKGIGGQKTRMTVDGKQVRAYKYLELI